MQTLFPVEVCGGHGAPPAMETTKRPTVARNFEAARDGRGLLRLARAARLERLLGETSENASVIDVHTHAGVHHLNLHKRTWPTAHAVRDLQFKLDHFGVATACVAPMETFAAYWEQKRLANTGELVPDPSRPEEFPYASANGQLLQEVSLFGPRLLPFVAVSPRACLERQAEALEIWTSEHSVYGLKVHPLANQSGADALVGTPVARLAEELGLAVLVHTGPDKWSQWPRALALAEAHPRLRVCLAHAGMWDRALLTVLQQHRPANVFVDLSPLHARCAAARRSVPGSVADKPLPFDFSDPGACLRTVAEALPDMLLFGTDEPWTQTPGPDGVPLTATDYSDELSALCGLGEGLARRVGQVNALRYLLGSS